MRKMSLQLRKELILSVRTKYQKSCWKEKCKILDGFVVATGYRRKYAINLLNSLEVCKLEKSASRKGKIKYNLAVKDALLVAWRAANEICAKRLVPFLPDLVAALEHHRHLSISTADRMQLLTISAATVDRILKSERCTLNGKGISTTRSGSLLKKQIKIRTFADWNEAQPGFLEGDLVAHCGDTTEGSFLNTLVLTDIASAWTEFLPLLCKSSANVVFGIDAIKNLLPFPLLGVDTDNGSEFINYELLHFCKENNITFTRSRAYKKNDQAHVEEKNGSIIRRLVGYDRYEGLKAWHSLVDLYAVLRLYVNYFQPSFKLISKKREGAKVTKKYDKAQTPYQRLINSEKIPQETKAKLKTKYEKLDPIDLLERLKKCQDLFWQQAWPKENRRIENKPFHYPEICDKNSRIVAEQLATCEEPGAVKKEAKTIKSEHITAGDLANVPLKTVDLSREQCANNKHVLENKKICNENRKYRYTKKPRKQMAVRTWRTRKDPFETIWDGLRLQLEVTPDKTAKSLLSSLIAQQPEKFNYKSLRTLQRRIACWRKEQCDKMKKQHKIYSSQKVIGNEYVSLAMEANI